MSSFMAWIRSWPFEGKKLLIDLVAMAVILLMVEAKRLHTQSIFAFRLWHGGVPLDNIPNSYNGNYSQGKKAGILIFVSIVAMEIFLAVTLDIGFAPGISEVVVMKSPSPTLGFATSPILLCVVKEEGEGVPLVKDPLVTDACDLDDGWLTYENIFVRRPLPDSLNELPENFGEEIDTTLWLVDGSQSLQKPPGWNESPKPRPIFNRSLENCTSVSPPVPFRISHLDTLSLRSSYKVHQSDVKSPLSTNVTEDDKIILMPPAFLKRQSEEGRLKAAGVTSETCENADLSFVTLSLAPDSTDHNVDYLRVSCSDISLPLSMVQPKGMCDNESHSLFLAGVSGRAVHVRDGRITGRGAALGCKSFTYEVTYDAYFANVSTCNVGEQAVSTRSILVNEVTGWYVGSAVNPTAETLFYAIAELNNPKGVSVRWNAREWSPPTDERSIWLQKPKDAVPPLSNDEFWVTGECNLTVRAGWLHESNKALITVYESCPGTAVFVNSGDELHIRQYSVTLPQDEAILRMVQFTLADSYLNCRGRQIKHDVLTTMQSDVLDELQCFNNLLVFTTQNNIGEEEYLEPVIVSDVSWALFGTFLSVVLLLLLYFVYWCVASYYKKPLPKHPETHHDFYLMGRRDAGDLKAGPCTSFGATPPDAYVGVAKVSSRSDHLGITAHPLPEPSGRAVLGQTNSSTTLDKPGSCSMTDTADISNASPPAKQVKRRKVPECHHTRQTQTEEV